MRIEDVLARSVPGVVAVRFAPSHAGADA